MDFISNKEEQNEEMLKAIGVKNVDELFSSIPDALKMPKIAEDDGLSEYEGMKLMQALAKKNQFPHFQNYLGAGAYEHHVPPIISSICSKAEFLTSYTPYQPEASQGMLQAIFEFQSALVVLTGMDVANASLYDGASAAAESMLMALRINKGRSKVLVANSIHPNYLAVVEQYLKSHEIKIELVPFLQDGSLDLKRYQELLDDQTAAVLLQYPNFFGGVDDASFVFQQAREAGALSILCANPLSFGLYKNAKEVLADIVTGDLQPFGLPLQFGGPYVGYIACQIQHLRQLPGRIVGETLDEKGKRGFVLTLQAREQHIRREKATSNICTNQALAALASLIGILWLGPKGVKELALTNYQRAAFLRENLSKIPGISIWSQSDFFNEFVVKFDLPLDAVLKKFCEKKINPGLSLSSYFKELNQHLLVAVTETKSLEDLNLYLEIARTLKT
ncbi:MAG TPA: aminomethyl-transferring glycine dehydrogenase subunit GcvPA [Parachlamydiaceae bacterium]|nr:aminomethyl-transferring glycine dehydrogenase subunit GcvPA [Parachlamydiaceae bacterium]